MAPDAASHHRASIKICGLTHESQADDCRRAGVTACGMVMARKGPRQLLPGLARRIWEHCHALGLRTVLVFMDQGADFVRDCIAAMPADYLQFHGAEEAGYCEQFGVPFIKACPVGREAVGGDGALEPSRLSAYYQRYSGAAAILLDHSCAGSGQSWRWQAIARRLGPRTIIAGGIDAGNVGEAVARTGIGAIDVSSGVEESPGRKSAASIAALAAAANRAYGLLRPEERRGAFPFPHSAH